MDTNHTESLLNHRMSVKPATDLTPDWMREELTTGVSSIPLYDRLLTNTGIQNTDVDYGRRV